MSAVRGLVVLGGIAAVPLGLAYGHAAYVTSLASRKTSLILICRPDASSAPELRMPILDALESSLRFQITTILSISNRCRKIDRELYVGLRSKKAFDQSWSGFMRVT